MKSVRILRPGEIVLRDEPVPSPSSGEALVRMLRVGICGTDRNIYCGEFSERVNFPLRPGHEWAGEIVALGPDAPGYRVGDLVTGESAVSCGKCPSCVRGEKYACTDTRAVGTVNAWDGAMSDYFLFPVRDLLPIPEGVDIEEAALVEPASNALMGVEYAGVRPGASVAVMGTGPIGLAAVAIARLYGATTVISVGRSEPKLQLAAQLGATHTVNTRADDPVRRIREITGGRGVDATLEISGAEPLFRAALEVTRAHGTVVLIGFYAHPLELNLNDLIFPLLTLRAAGGGWGGYAQKVLELMGRGALRLGALITHRCALEDVPRQITDWERDRAHTVKVMVCGDA